ncbi:MAG: hypothetical protein AB1Z57_08175 [Acidimicrobiia bacterium]
MPTEPPPATATLDEALELVDELERRCCEPGRSPRMSALRTTIDRARSSIDTGEPERVAALLEQAGAQVGHLQVGCCAPNRLPLYAGVLERLTLTRLRVGPDMHDA